MWHTAINCLFTWLYCFKLYSWIMVSLDKTSNYCIVFAYLFMRKSFSHCAIMSAPFSLKTLKNPSVIYPLQCWWVPRLSAQWTVSLKLFRYYELAYKCIHTHIYIYIIYIYNYIWIYKTMYIYMYTYKYMQDI